MEIINELNKSIDAGRSVTLHFVSGETQNFTKDYAKLTPVPNEKEYFQADYEDGIVEIFNLKNIEKITIAK